jgi:hypothetical protein
VSDWLSEAAIEPSIILDRRIRTGIPGNVYSGLWYPIIVAAMSMVVGPLFLPETKNVDITKTGIADV